MALKRMDHVVILVEDLDAVVELGLELEGRLPAEGTWVESVIGVRGVRQEAPCCAHPTGTAGSSWWSSMRRSPYARSPPRQHPGHPPHHVAVDDVLSRLRSHGAELVGEVARYENVYRLCCFRSPEGIITNLAEELTAPAREGGPEHAQEARWRPRGAGCHEASVRGSGIATLVAASAACSSQGETVDGRGMRGPRSVSGT